MKKVTIIVCLALCLICVKGFVKRDLSKGMDDLKKKLDPENIKKQIDDNMKKIKEHKITKRDTNSTGDSKGLKDLDKALDPKQIQKKFDENLKKLKEELEKIKKGPTKNSN